MNIESPFEYGLLNLSRNLVGMQEQISWLQDTWQNRTEQQEMLTSSSFPRAKN